jgi:hypothetical protein
MAAREIPSQETTWRLFELYRYARGERSLLSFF